MYRIMQKEWVGGSWHNVTSGVLHFYGLLEYPDGNPNTVQNSTIAQAYLWFRHETAHDTKLLKDDGSEAKVLTINLTNHERSGYGGYPSDYQVNKKWEAYDLWQAMANDLGMYTVSQTKRARLAFEMWFAVCHGNLPDTSELNEAYDVVFINNERRLSNAR